MLAYGDTRSDFETGRNLFSNGQYERAVEVFSALLADPVDPKAVDARKRREIVQAARPLFAATLVALGRSSEADRVIAEHLRDDPFYEPPAGQFPEPVMQRFIFVMSERAEELEGLRQKILRERQDAVVREQQQQLREQRRLAELARLATEETVVTTRSRVTALVPFGVGQFQNGNSGLGVFFAASEALGIAASLGTLLAAQHYAAVDCRIADCEAAGNTFRAVRTANWASVGVTTALVLAGVLEAQVGLVPVERATRKRTVPSPTVEPVAEATSKGASLGFVVRF